MNYKKLLLNMLPYACANRLLINKRNDLMHAYLDYRKKEATVEKTKVTPNYENLVSVQGLGYSGSGAVLDFLCEIEECNVIGFDKGIEKIGIDSSTIEFEFMNYAGGLFDIEKIIGIQDRFINDASIHRLIRLARRFPLFKNNEYCRCIFFDFLNSILDEVYYLKRPYFNFHTEEWGETAEFLLKDMSKEDYINKCRQFLIKFYNHVNPMHKRLVVCDQLLSGLSQDKDRFEAYIPNIKTIICFRDPRDIYTFAVKNGIDWLPHKTVEEFISYYKYQERNVLLDRKEDLVIRFEDLVNDYDNQTSRILSYLNLKQEAINSNTQKTLFNPSVSKVNIGIWRKSNLPVSDFDKIKSSLQYYCYN